MGANIWQALPGPGRLRDHDDMHPRLAVKFTPGHSLRECGVLSQGGWTHTSGRVFLYLSASCLILGRVDVESVCGIVIVRGSSGFRENQFVCCLQSSAMYTSRLLVMQGDHSSANHLLCSTFTHTWLERALAAAFTYS